MQICNPSGRDCIEHNSAETFNCSKSCTGIYADVQWVGSDIEEEINDHTDNLIDLVENDPQKILALIEKKFTVMRKDVGKIMKSTIGKGMEEQDKETYKRLISEYRKFKTKSVKYLRFNSAADLSSYGKPH